MRSMILPTVHNISLIVHIPRKEVNSLHLSKDYNVFPNRLIKFKDDTNFYGKNYRHG